MAFLGARAGRRQFLTAAGAAGIAGGSLMVASPSRATSDSGAPFLTNHIPLGASERDRRWAAVRSLMKQAGVDVLLLTDEGGGTRPVADIRYLAGYARTPLALLFFSDGEPEVLTGGVEYANAALWMRRLSWVKKCRFAPNLAAAIADRLAAAGTSLTVGVKDKRNLGADLLAALDGRLVELGNILGPLRAIKSPAELTLIRRSAEIADYSVTRMLQRVGAGTPQYMVHAESEFGVYSMGAEGNGGNYYVFQDGEDESYSYGQLLAKNPLRAGDFVIFEVGPNYNGYFSQLASGFSLGRPREPYLKMYRTSLAARRAGLELLKPGGNLRDVALRMKAVTEESGFVMADYAAGHVVGLELTELRVATTIDFELKPGMAIALHAVVENEALDHILHADTYFVTDDGYERVNKFKDELRII